MRTTTTTFGGHYTAQNMAALAASFPKLTIRPAAQVLGWSDDQKAAFCLARDTQNLAGAEAGYRAACAALGRANRLRSVMRGYWQAHAMRQINAARASLRRARAALAASVAAFSASGAA
jgi:hypothetical protein